MTRVATFARGTTMTLHSCQTTAARLALRPDGASQGAGRRSHVSLSTPRLYEASDDKRQHRASSSHVKTSVKPSCSICSLILKPSIIAI